MKPVAFAVLLTCLLGSFAAHAQGRLNNYLFIPGVPGDSHHQGRDNWIDLVGFSWGGTVDGRNVCIEDVTFFKLVDSASPVLATSMAIGTVYPELKFEATIYKGDDKGLDPVSVELYIRGASISSFVIGEQLVDPTGNSIRVDETFTVSFEELQFDYTPYYDDGAADPVHSAVIYPERGCK